MPIQQIENPDGTWVDAPILYQSKTYGNGVAAVRVDGGGNLFIGSRFIHNNATVVYIEKIDVNGNVVGKWNVVIEGQPHVLNPDALGIPKIDAFDFAPSGTDLFVALGGHVLDSERENPVALAKIPGVWVPYTGSTPEQGADGAYVPPSGGSQPESVDYARIQSGVDASLDTTKHWIKDQLAYVLETYTVPHAGQAAANAIIPHLADALYRPILDAIWLDLEKIAQGTDNPTGMNAQQLHDAWVALHK